MTSKENRSKADIEWGNRTLCSDESCIGVIGPDGRCKVCGKPFEGEFKLAVAVEDIDEAEIEDRPEEYPDEGPEEYSGEDPEEYSGEDLDDKTGIDWENRTLCIDESCIGVIGPDGRCKECGKSLNDDTA